jgi:hypothetical protein
VAWCVENMRVSEGGVCAVCGWRVPLRFLVWIGGGIMAQETSEGHSSSIPLLIRARLPRLRPRRPVAARLPSLAPRLQCFVKSMCNVMGGDRARAGVVQRVPAGAGIQNPPAREPFGAGKP